MSEISSQQHHSLHAHNTVSYWDNSLQPVLEIESGDTIEIECVDASGGQLSASSTAADVGRLDMTRVNPVTGPIFVKGAKPGDTLAVEIIDLTPGDWGWTAIIPEFGLLADEFPDPWLQISKIDADAGTAQLLDGVVIPLEPFPGTIGVAPAANGQFPVLPPTQWGGNLDIKHLRKGTTLYLPIGVPGALFSIGDTHAAMGDGEVCGTAIESPMAITVKLSIQQRSISQPQFHLPAGALAHTEQSAYQVCTGVAPDLTQAAANAVRGAIDYICEQYGRTPQEAYAIVSVAGDLRIHELVDAPNWVVGAFVPEAIFVD